MPSKARKALACVLQLEWLEEWAPLALTGGKVTELKQPQHPHQQAGTLATKCTKSRAEEVPASHGTSLTGPEVSEPSQLTEP